MASKQSGLALSLNDQEPARSPPPTIYDPGYDPRRAQAAKVALSKVLDTEVRVTVTDGRVFVGTLKCTDRDRNLVVADTMEYRKGKERYVALIMIPGKHIVKFEVTRRVHAQISATEGQDSRAGEAGADDDSSLSL